MGKKILYIGTAVVAIAGLVVAWKFLTPMKTEQAVAIIKEKAPNAQYQPGIMTGDFLVEWAKALQRGAQRFIYQTIVYTSSNGLPYRPGSN